MSILPTGTVTFLFTDIQGSTKLAQEHHNVWEVLRARHHAILNRAVQAHDGHVFQIVGDEFCIAFHIALDAVLAAADAQRMLFMEPWQPAPIKVRMGIHTGTALAGNDLDRSLSYTGYTTLARTSRLMSAGHGGQVLISLATEELIRDELPADLGLRNMGDRRLKDLIRPEQIFQLMIPGLPTDFPPLKTLDAYRHNLPIQLTTFIGREKELTKVRQAVLEHRLVTLTGAGGTGKTRLSLHVAADLLDTFPNGVWFVDLTSTTSPELIPQTILSAFGIGDQPGITSLQLLNDYVRERNLLLVLDNCEHLINETARLVTNLLTCSEKLKILATSREALGVGGELNWYVPSLTLPDIHHLPPIEALSQYEAVSLFIDRATLAQPHFTVTNDNAPAIAQICHRLDGIPLAIELAAARVKVLDVEQINKRLDDRFHLLTSGVRTSLPRHQTLRATIDWSYNLLSENEKLLLCRLSVFVGGWDMEAAEQVCAGSNDISPDEVLDLLTHLVDKSLVILEGSRYRMLETTRQYACEKLLDLEEGHMLRMQHLAYFLDLAGKVEQEIHGPNQVYWMDRIKMDNDNIRAALDWCFLNENTEAALCLLGAWARTGRHTFSEIQSWFVRIKALPDIKNHPALYARLLNYLGQGIFIRGDWRYGVSLIEDSQALWLKLGAEGELGLAEALDILGEMRHGDKTSQSFFEQSLKIYQKHGNDWGIGRVLFGLGHQAIWDRDYAEAQKQFMKSLTKFQELGDQIQAANVLNSLGELARLQDDYEQAGKYYQQVITMQREVLHGEGSACLFNFAWVSLHLGEYHEAKAFLNESFRSCNEDGDKFGMICCLLGFAGILGMSRKPERAARLFGAVERLLKGSSTTLDLSDQKEFDYCVAAVRKQLDEGTFAAAWTDGQDMTLEQAIKFASKEIDE